MERKIHGWWEGFSNLVHLYILGEKGQEPQRKKNFMEMNSQDPLFT